MADLSGAFGQGVQAVAQNTAGAASAISDWMKMRAQQGMLAEGRPHWPMQSVRRSF